MASGKRKTAGEGADAAAAVGEAKKEVGVGRVTRSSARRVNWGTATEPVVVKKNAVKKERVVKKAKVEVKKEEVKADEGKKEVKADEGKKEVKARGGGGSKTIVIEHCKQCNSFKTRAFQVKEGLESAIKGIQVLVNPEKPRRGCFEIREQGGEAFITLLDMKRPFPPLKALNMEKVISDIIEKVK
uniref:Selenoprotein H n=1 Tax=Kalanchoe fedtschenkoi TaxID=63787 RepID=A0A7N0V5M5_KALFE